MLAPLAIAFYSYAIYMLEMLKNILNIKNIPELSIDAQNHQESKINLINNFQGQKIIQTSYINRRKELFIKTKQIQIIETPPYKSTPGFIYKSNKKSLMLIGDKELNGTKYISTVDETTLTPLA